MIRAKGIKRFFTALLSVAAIVPVWAEEVALLPISATYSVDMAGKNTAGLEFPVLDGEKLVLTIQAATGLELSLITPDGRQITPANAADNGAAFSTLLPSTPYETLFAAVDATIIELNSPQRGMYVLNFVRGTETNSFFVVQVTTMGTGLRMGMVLGGSVLEAPANVPVSVVMMLFEDERPVTHARAEVTRRDADGKPVASLVLRDDGIVPDPRAHDGAYTGSFTPGTPGKYLLRGFASGHTSSGAPFEASVDVRLDALPENIRVTGSYSDKGIDEDGDGFFDYVDFIFEYTGNLRLAEGIYFVDVYLRSANGKKVYEVGRLNTEGGALSVRFEADKLKTLAVDGPYMIHLFMVRQNDHLIARFTDLGETQPWRLAQLERPNTVLTPVQDDFGWDGNNDGLIDWFRVTFGADTLLPGYYGVSADIRSPNGTLLDSSGIVSIYLEKKNNTVPVWFYGPAIAAAGEDGPYRLTNVLVYPHFRARATSRVASLGETREYRCQEFTGCAADVSALFEILLSKIDELDINQGIKQSLRVKVANAKRAYERGQNPTAHKQLGAFTHELQAQAAKHLDKLLADDLERLAVELVKELDE